MNQPPPTIPTETAPPASSTTANPLKLSPHVYDRALACVHCGLCLPACPTYVQTGHEAESPRGRIQLIRGLSDSLIQPTASVRDHLDNCLDCRGCESACPSGVVYHELIENIRDRMSNAPPGSQAAAAPRGRVAKFFAMHVLIHPLRAKIAMLPARLLQKIGLYNWLRNSKLMNLLPASLRAMERMLPGSGPLWPGALPESTPPAAGSTPANLTIGFFPGCIGSVLFADVNRQAIELLSACGVTVRVPLKQSCCGALHQHGGQLDVARRLARENIDAFLPKDGPQVGLIVSQIAGCGSTLREYTELLREDPQYAERAAEFTRRCRDISEVLVNLPIPFKYPLNTVAAYHDACHLAHAQKITAQPRQLLAKIPGLKLVPLPESDLCCGAAGTYNLTHPKMAASLANRKLDNLAATGAEICVAGNVGCALHLAAQARARGQNVQLLHPVQLLFKSVFGPADRP